MRDLNLRLNSSNSLSDNDLNKIVEINLLSSNKILPTNEYNEIINENEVFNRERSLSDTYRLCINLNPHFTNVLYNLSGVDSLKTFSTSLILDNSYPSNSTINDDEDLTFDKAFNEKLLEENGWFYYLNNSKSFGNCEKKYLKPYPNDFELNENNWDITITYPFKNISRKGDITFNGLQIIDSRMVTVGGVNYLGLGTATKHGLVIGDKVKISGILPSSIDGEYLVVSLGLDNKQFEENYFIIDLQFSSFIGITNDSRMVRNVYGVYSRYYFRVLKKVPTTVNNEILLGDYELNDLSYGLNIYSDLLKQIIFNTEIDLEGLTDNLGRPLTEIFLTLIKKPNKDFSSNKSGIEVPNFGTNSNFPSVPDIRRIHNGGVVPFLSNQPIETNITVNNIEFFCDVVEYNDNELFEKVLSDVNYRFSNLNREYSTSMIINGVNTIINPRYEGYFYKPHYRIKIKGLSNYIEENENNDIENVPEYKTILPDGKVIWRDVLDRGINDIDGEINDYPFLNGNHFLFKNFNIFLKRQDPFNENGLFTSSYPPDQYGSTFNDNYITINSQDVC